MKRWVWLILTLANVLIAFIDAMRGDIPGTVISSTAFLALLITRDAWLNA